MSELPEGAGPVLTGLARYAIASASPLAGRGTLNPGRPALPNWTNSPGASFVTLTQDGHLRGCIGSLQAWRALHDDVADNARSAAFRDPRFPPLRAAELDITRIEVSVLSAPAPMEFASQADALSQLRPGTDGLILAAGGRRATFLPQVWDELPDPSQFVAQLLRKAGLSPNYWGDDVALQRYTVTAFAEPERR